MPQKTPDAGSDDVTLLLKEWASPAYQGVKPGTEDPWPVGKSRQVPAQTAAYLTTTFPDHFLPVGKASIPELAKSALDWLNERAEIIIAEIKGGRLDNDLLALSREERKNRNRKTVLDAIKARMMGELGGEGGEAGAAG